MSKNLLSDADIDVGDAVDVAVHMQRNEPARRGADVERAERGGIHLVLRQPSMITQYWFVGVWIVDT